MYGSGNQPVIVLKEGTERSKDKEAQFNNISAAKAVADAVRSTLGPKGMDKMLVNTIGDVVITNDGVTILKEIDVQHPAAKMVVEVAKTQDTECGDGTTSSVVIAGELLKQSEELINANVHPTVITNGYKMAAQKAVEVLNEIAVDAKDDKILKQVAATALTGKSVGEEARIARFRWTWLATTSPRRCSRRVTASTTRRSTIVFSWTTSRRISATWRALRSRMSPTVRA